jgi:hypothetical protein
MKNTKKSKKDVKKNKTISKRQPESGEKIPCSTSKMRDSKQAMLIKLLKRPGGATIDEMANATGWQRHSVRGVMSGVLKKRLGLSIASEKEDRGRIYRIST